MRLHLVDLKPAPIQGSQCVSQSVSVQKFPMGEKEVTAARCPRESQKKTEKHRKASSYCVEEIRVDAGGRFTFYI